MGPGAEAAVVTHPAWQAGRLSNAVLTPLDGHRGRCCFLFFCLACRLSSLLPRLAPRVLLLVTTDLHVVFGHVTDGMDVITDLEKYGSADEGAVTQRIEITAAGCAD